jgi:polysaccharide biosynthesis/export protein
MAAPKPEADLSKVAVYRDGETTVHDYTALIEKGDMSQNIDLQPGDMIYVPRAKAEEVMVLGAVQRNGAVSIEEEENRDLLKIVTLTAPLANADTSRITIYRQDQEPIYRNLRSLQDEGDLSQTMDVQPGDVIVVPPLDEIYVLGAVAKPGAYPLDPDWNLLDIISRVGQGARAQERVIVIRQRPDGTAEHIEVNLRQLRAGNLPEPVKIKPGDVLYVPSLGAPKGDLWRQIRENLWIVGTLANLMNW